MNNQIGKPLLLGAFSICTALLTTPLQAEASTKSDIEFHVTRSEYSALDRKNVQDFVYKEFLESGKSNKYGKVVLEMPATHRGSSYLILNLLHKNDYGMSHARINLKNGKVSKVIHNYEPADGEYYDDTRQGTCPDPEMRVVWGMAKVGHNNPQAVKAMKKAEDAVKKTNLKYKYLTRRETTRQNYKDWMACPRVTYFGSISHGSPRGFQLEDGTLGSSYFRSQADSENFKCRTMWMTACQAHNNPLLKAIKETGLSYFVSGIRNVSFGRGDRTHGCFWDKIFEDEGSITVEQATKDCTDEFYGGWPAVYGMTKQGVEPWECEEDSEDPPPSNTGDDGDDDDEGDDGDEDSAQDSGDETGEDPPPSSDTGDESDDDEGEGETNNDSNGETSGSDGDDETTSDPNGETSDDDDIDIKTQSNDKDSAASRDTAGCTTTHTRPGMTLLLLALAPFGLMRFRKRR